MLAPAEHLWEVVPWGPQLSSFLRNWSQGPPEQPGQLSPVPCLNPHSSGEHGRKLGKSPEILPATGHTQALGRPGLTCPGSERNRPSPNTRTPSQARTGPPRTRASESTPATGETEVREMPPCQQLESTHRTRGLGKVQPPGLLRFIPAVPQLSRRGREAAGRRGGKNPRGRGLYAGRPRETRLSLSLHFTFYYQTHRGAERIFSYWINLFT